MDRKAEEFQDDEKEWDIYFDTDKDHLRQDKTITVRFFRKKEGSHFLTEEEIENLKQDLKDLGKLRIIKQGREFLK